jgi:hypothetical protein
MPPVSDPNIGCAVSAALRPKNSLRSEALAKPLGNEGRHGPEKLREVLFLTESIVASVFVSFAQIRPCFTCTCRVDQLAWHECCGGSVCQF